MVLIIVLCPQETSASAVSDAAYSVSLSSRVVGVCSKQAVKLLFTPLFISVCLSVCVYLSYCALFSNTSFDVKLFV